MTPCLFLPQIHLKWGGLKIKKEHINRYTALDGLFRPWIKDYFRMCGPEQILCDCICILISEFVSSFIPGALSHISTGNSQFTLPPCNQHENAFYWSYPKTSQTTGLSSIPKGLLAFTPSGTWHSLRAQKALAVLGTSGTAVMGQRSRPAMPFWILMKSTCNQQAQFCTSALACLKRSGQLVLSGLW